MSEDKTMLPHCSQCQGKEFTLVVDKGNSSIYQCDRLSCRSLFNKKSELICCPAEGCDSTSYFVMSSANRKQPRDLYQCRRCKQVFADNLEIIEIQKGTRIPNSGALDRPKVNSGISKTSLKHRIK